jgi:hypothetical protein
MASREDRNESQPGGEAVREDMRRLMAELSARPELNDLDDEQSVALAVSETRVVRRERARKRRDQAAELQNGGDARAKILK